MLTLHCNCQKLLKPKITMILIYTVPRNFFNLVVPEENTEMNTSHYNWNMV